jgi:triosephosphate isomerase
VTAAPSFIGVSLKMYFDQVQALEWCRLVSELARRHRGVRDGDVELAILPGFTTLSAAIDVFAGTNVQVGAQDLFWEDRGPFTGEVSGRDLSVLGCRFVEVGHAERRRLFGETDAMVGQKVAAAVRNGLTPIVCIGEEMVSPAPEASIWCTSQLEAAMGDVGAPPAEPGPDGPDGPKTPGSKGPGPEVVVAYEPVWAIGASAAAPVAHIRDVCDAIRRWLDASAWAGNTKLIYGGSANKGLLTALKGSVDGLFLGRFAHDPENLERILTEAGALRGPRAGTG